MDYLLSSNTPLVCCQCRTLPDIARGPQTPWLISLLSTVSWTHVNYSGCLATWTYGITVRWFKVLSKASLAFFFLPCHRTKLMPRSPLQAHQLPLVHAAIEKLTSAQQNKWQNATKGSGEWTGPNGAVFKEDLPVGPRTPKEGSAEKGDLDSSPC